MKVLRAIFYTQGKFLRAGSERSALYFLELANCTYCAVPELLDPAPLYQLQATQTYDLLEDLVSVPDVKWVNWAEGLRASIMAYNWAHRHGDPNLIISRYVDVARTSIVPVLQYPIDTPLHRRL